jgi:hypothetical protein
MKLIQSVQSLPRNLSVCVTNNTQQNTPCKNSSHSGKCGASGDEATLCRTPSRKVSCIAACGASCPTTNGENSHRNYAENHYQVKSRPSCQRCLSETGTDDGYWVMLKNGYADLMFDPCQPTHTIHEWSLRVVLQRMRDVKPCSCKDCKET